MKAPLIVVGILLALLAAMLFVGWAMERIAERVL